VVEPAAGCASSGRSGTTAAFKPKKPLRRREFEPNILGLAMPAAPTEITDEQIERTIQKSVADVLSTMASEKIEFAGRTPNPPLHSKPGIEGPHLVASVGFIGDLEGIINTHFDNEIALLLSSKILGMSVAEVVASGVLTDAMGELANMITGVFKNTLGEVGCVCKLTLPSIIRGSDFHVDHAIKNGRRYIFNFRCQGRVIVTDIIMEED
jgi:chemotaxis protein CheX